MSDEFLERSISNGGALITRYSLLITLFALSLAGQVPNSTSTQIKKFKFVPPTIKKGGEIHWSVAEGGKQEYVRDEYAILEKDVKVDYQDIKMQAGQIKVNIKTKDAGGEGGGLSPPGKSQKKADDNTSHMKRGVITSCDNDNPSWSFRVGDAT